MTEQKLILTPAFVKNIFKAPFVRIDSKVMRVRKVVAALLVSLSCLAPARAGSARQGSKPVEFADVTAQAGIRWGVRRLAPGVKYLIETMGGGGGFLDYDDDGDLDIYLVNYTQTPQPDPKAKLRDALYRNNGDGTFTDVTDAAGVSAEGMLGMGFASADYDNDGR